jgi:hypothetical protein
MSIGTGLEVISVRQPSIGPIVREHDRCRGADLRRRSLRRRLAAGTIRSLARRPSSRFPGRRLGVLFGRRD